MEHIGIIFNTTVITMAIFGVGHLVTTFVGRH